MFFIRKTDNGSYQYILSDSLLGVELEVKSGKTYTRHHALDNVMNNTHYEINTGIVLCNDNIYFNGNVWYCPIYLTGFFKKEENLEDIIYSIDLSQLQ